MIGRIGYGFVAFVLGTVVPARASDSLQVSPAAGVLIVRSVPAAADVVLDSAFVGRTPVDSVRVSPGRHRLQLISPGRRSWDAATVTDSIDVAAGDTVRRVYTLHRPAWLWSIPSGAEVLLRDSVVGSTPLMLAGTRALSLLQVRLAGYRAVEIRSDTLGSFASVVRLQPADGAATEPPWDMNGSFVRERRRETLIASSAGLMVLSGVLAAAWKNKANDEYDAYLATGDASLLDSTHRLDTRAGVALAVTQVSFLLLSYLLLSE